MDPGIIIGNACTLLATGANAVSSTRKSAKGVLGWQCISQVIYFVCAVVLRGYSGAVQNVVSLLRNLAAIRNVKSKALEWSLTVAGVVLGLVFNNRGLMGLLPVVGNLQYTLAIFRFQDNPRILKLSFLLSCVAYAVFNAVILNYVGVVTDSVVALTTAIVLIKDAKKKA